MRILVIEDEKKVSDFIKKGLEEQAYVVDTAMDGTEGERLAGYNEYDVIILDVLLPKQDGWTTCRNIRQNGVKTPVLMLTSLGETEDKVKGLDLGADDYLTKPFAFDEFLARIRALIRRSGSGETTHFTLADLELDLLERKVIRAGREIQLTQKEFALLEYMLRYKKKVMTRTQISEHVWGIDFDTGSNVVDSYIKMLRKKIDKDFSPQLIHTVVGVGYVMREEKMIDKSQTGGNKKNSSAYLKIFKTVRGKLTLSFITIFGITLIGFSFVLYNVFAKQSRDDFDIVMSVLASSISETIRENGINQDILNEVKEFNNPGLSAFYGYTEILNSTESVVMQSSQLKDVSLPLERNRILAALNGSREITTIYIDDPGPLWDSRGARILYFPATHRQHKYVVILVAPLSSIEGMLANLRLIIFIAIPVTLLIASIVGWLFSKRAYAPVDELVTKTNTITAEKLHMRLKVSDADDEISHLAETLNYMIERLEQSFSTLKQFTSDASHELRTPLTIMRGEIEVALKKSRNEQEYLNILKGNLEEVRRLQNIVEGLLTLSQYENNRVTIQHEDINLADIVIESVTKSRILAESKNIRLVLKLDEENPEAVIINGDSRKLLNVFLNIFDNAIKYSNENTEIKCFTGITKTDNYAYVTIKDEGIGIPEESLKNIFERFYREDSSRTRGEGFSLGLGLSIVKAVVEAHNGKIEVTSEKGKGSAFTIFLPYTK